MDNPQSLLSIDPKQYLRFAPLVLGLIITLAATGMQTWKESAMASGQGAIKTHQHELAVQKHNRSQADNAETTKKYTERIEKLEMKRVEILLAASAKEAAAGSGVWLLAMMKWVGISLSAFGFLVVGVLGGSYEQTGALIGLGFIVAQLV
jgi:hypothetical protein